MNTTLCSEEFWATVQNLAEKDLVTLDVRYANTGLDTRKKELEPIILGLIKASPAPSLPTIRSNHSIMTFQVVSVEEVVRYNETDGKYVVRVNITCPL